MLHLFVIVMVGAIVLHDMQQAGATDPQTPATPAWITALIVIIAMAWIAIGVQLRIWMCTARMRAGDVRAISAAHRAVRTGRFAVVMAHLVCIFLLGWVEAVRRVTGDLIFVDEALMLLPSILAIVAGWWSVWPVERDARRAVWIRILDEGRAIHREPTRSQFVIANIRQQLLFALVPIALLYSWAETTWLIVDWMRGAEPVVRTTAWLGLNLSTDTGAETFSSIFQLAGVIVIIALMPAVLRLVWDTVPLRQEAGNGDLYSRLMGMCKTAGVKVRRVLVWRTHSTMMNGAVIGLIGQLRYILLTDLLLEELNQRQVEAVMAHEIAHVKKHHMAWLAGAMILGIFGSGLVMDWAVWALYRIMGHAPTATDQPAGITTIDWLVLVGSVVVGLWVFGVVSRRFEWQADAFAVSVLTRERHEAMARSGIYQSEAERGQIGPHEVEAMAGALHAVARGHHVPIWKWGWRHGSIGYRIRRLVALQGQRIDELEIDRRAARIKQWIMLGLIGMAILGVVGEVLG